jgi:hypothetical protein
MEPEAGHGTAEIVVNLLKAEIPELVGLPK